MRNISYLYYRNYKYYVLTYSVDALNKIPFNYTSRTYEVKKMYPEVLSNI